MSGGGGYGVVSDEVKEMYSLLELRDSKVHAYSRSSAFTARKAMLDALVSLASLSYDLDAIDDLSIAMGIGGRVGGVGHSYLSSYASQADADGMGEPGTYTHIYSNLL